MNDAPIEADLLIKAGAVVTMNVDRQVIGSLGQPIKDHEANVVARCVVFWPRITETG